MNNRIIEKLTYFNLFKDSKIGIILKLNNWYNIDQKIKLIFIKNRNNDSL